MSKKKRANKHVKIQFINPVFLLWFKDRHPTQYKRSALTLTALQGTLLLVLLLSEILIAFSDKTKIQFNYTPFVVILILLLSISILLNLFGRYKSSLIITIICIVAAPWISILCDPQVRNGDILPVLFVGLTIQLCAILMNEKAILILAITEMAAVLTIIRARVHITDLNWLSLCAFILFSSAISISYSIVNRKQMQQIHDMSIRDSLTGLFNRRYMEETFDRELARAQRKNQPLAIIMTDVDRFKVVNDTYGHIVGDLVLVKIAGNLASSVRSSDVVCRYGGDEFIIILPDCSREQAINRAELLKSLILQSNMHFGDKVLQGISLSFGIAAFPHNGENRAEIISAADQALYLAKQLGRKSMLDFD